MDAVIDMRGVVKGFGHWYSRDSVRVLDGLDLSVPPGTVLGLLGKNGAGKSTLIKCALGLLRPQAGQSHVFGEDSWDLSEHAKARLGYVPQDVRLYNWMRVGQVVAYTASFYPRWNAKLVETLRDRWEIDFGQKVRNLSPGQLQRVGILLSMGHEPELLVLDEPAASLDPVARHDFLRAILDVVGQAGRTVLFSTHITSDLERVASHVAILRGGRIAYMGELDALKDEVKRWCIYPSDGQSPPTAESLRSILPEPKLLHIEAGPGRLMATVRGLDEAARQRIEADHSVRIEVEDLNLEDIFLEMHHG